MIDGVIYGKATHSHALAVNHHYPVQAAVKMGVHAKGDARSIEKLTTIDCSEYNDHYMHVKKSHAYRGRKTILQEALMTKLGWCKVKKACYWTQHHHLPWVWLCGQRMWHLG
jgi:hypothetical protein